MNYKEIKTDNIYLVTGAAGFIGYFLSKSILEHGGKVIGIDNLNDYYDVNLKYSRLNNLESFDKFSFIKFDISEKRTYCKYSKNTNQI